MSLLKRLKNSKKLQRRRLSRDSLETKNSSNKSLGEKGENIAEKYLIRNGYVVLDKNVSSKFAEIDILACENDTLVFVEVKTRSSIKYGLPEEAVNARKQTKIKKFGLNYAQRNPNLSQKLRIDIVSILINDNGQNIIKLIKGE